MTRQPRAVCAALIALIILQVIMLLALYARVAPHPPATTPLFGIAPFLGAALATAAASLVVGPRRSTAGRGLALLAAAMALISFGPQKYFDAQFPLIWPAVIAGQVAAVAVVFNALRAHPPRPSARDGGEARR